MKMDVEKIMKAMEATKAMIDKYRNYLESDSIPPEQMLLELEQHQKQKCFPRCFFCAADKIACEELLK